MNILITGGCGFLGTRLARTLLQHDKLTVGGQPQKSIRQIILTDLVSPSADLLSDDRIQFVGGNLRALLAEGRLFTKKIDLVFHLAAAVSAECEEDFDLGMSSNLDTTLALLQACRRSECQPTVVFASSVAVFGSRPGESWRDTVIEDDTLPTPQSSYGIQKFIGEQLMADFGRKGFIRARSVRLMTVSVRPGKPNGAASGFLSGMIREPLSGLPARVPVDPETPVALASPARTIDGLIRASQTSDDHWGALTAMNLPSLRVTVGEMAQTLQRLGGAEAFHRLDWVIDPTIARVVKSWPGQIACARAARLGLAPDSSFDAIVQQFIDEGCGTLPAR